MKGIKDASPWAAGPEALQDPAARYYPRLEALRGLAALSVAAFHSWQTTWLDAAGRTRDFFKAADGVSPFENLGALVLRVVGNGFGAVVLFFVISGFVLSGSLRRGPQDLASGASRFLIARLFRIYPAVLVTIAVFAALFWTSRATLPPEAPESARAFINGPAGYTAFGLLLNAMLVDASIDGVMWSLQVELVAIPLIFVVYHAWRRWGVVALVAPSVILATLSFWGPWNRVIGAPGLFGEIEAFVPGIAAFLVAPRLIERCSPRIASIIFAGAAACFLASRPILGFMSHWTPIAEAVFGATAVSVLAFGRPDALGAIFDLSLIRFFGRISYSFYLLHPLTLIIMWKSQRALTAAMATGVPPVVVGILIFIASVMAVTPLAYAMYLFVERQGIAAARKLQHWHAAGRRPS